MSAIERKRLGAGYTVRLYHDESAQSPREWDNLAVLANAEHDPTRSGYADPDDKEAAEKLLTAWQRWRDHHLVERYARVFLDAVAYGRVHVHRDLDVMGIVTRSALDQAANYAGRSLTTEHAGEWLDQELDAYQRWACGEACVVVVESPDGVSASRGDVYPDGLASLDDAHVAEVANELVHELPIPAVRVTPEQAKELHELVRSAATSGNRVGLSRALAITTGMVGRIERRS